MKKFPATVRLGLVFYSRNQTPACIKNEKKQPHKVSGMLASTRANNASFIPTVVLTDTYLVSV